MWRRARAGGLVLAVIAVFVCSGVGPAAAAPELRLSPASGPPGSTFLVTGTGFAPAEVVIRWGDEAGPELGRAVGPDFTVEVTVPPDAPSNSHPVMGVVTDGGSVSTSSASFQVTSSEPAEPPPTTSTTVADLPVDSTPATTATTAPASSAPSAAGGGLSRTDSVGGGVDGGAMADTTNGGGEAGSDTTGGRGSGAGASPGVAATGATGATGAATTTNVPGADAGGPAGAAPPPPGAAGAAGAGPPAVSGDDRAGASRPGAGDASGSALAPRPTCQSAGVVRNPLLLFVGLGLVFAAGVILAVRNHQRTALPPEQPGQ